MKLIAIILAVAFVVIAVVYFVVPAGSLPGFFPGFETGSPRLHVKHGAAALAVAAVLFAVAWFMGRR
jgi:amino acid permease